MLRTLLLTFLSSASCTIAYGAYDPVFTPFTANGSLNLTAVPEYAKYTTEQGTNTIILGGSTGEWPSMTTDERIQTLRAWRAALDALDPSISPHGRVPRLMFHAGDTALDRAIELAKAAKAANADAILIVAPCIMRPATIEMLLEVIGLVADAAGGLPSWYYHYPSLYNVDFPIAEFLTLNSQRGRIPTLEGVKFISSNMTDFARATEVAGGKYRLVSTHLLDGLAAGSGSSGAIAYTPQASLADAMYTAHAAGNASAAQAAADRFTLLGHLLTKPGGKSQARASARIFAPRIDLGPPRLPLADIDDAAFAALRQSLVENGFVPP